MTEETAIRIAEALESIKDAIGAIEALAITSTIVFGIVFFFYIIMKD